MGNPEQQIVNLLAGQAHAPYIGEPVSQLEHALQCAHLAESAGADEELILACLLHDIGHVCDPRAASMDDVGAKLHEFIGAGYLRASGFTERVAGLVEQHVNAKRYLVATNPDYALKLSSASKRTLEFQGGSMSQQEVERFEALPEMRDILRLRAWDEAAKEPGAGVPRLAHYVPMLMRNRTTPLSHEQLRRWREKGYLRISGWFSPAEVDALREAVTSIQQWPDTPGKWMKYYEDDKLTRLCRIENFAQYSAVMERLLNGGSTRRLVGTLMGEPAVLYKEKINFKLPGGQGFLPHQDAPAFTTFGHDYHITLMLSIDETTVQNGCLEVVPGAHDEGLLPSAADLTIDPAVVESLSWTPIETRPGDLVLFDSFLPHRSRDNRSRASRRALYATYNRERDGDVRREYFVRKRQAMPPPIEREPGKRYDAGEFNVGNPITNT